MRDEEGDWQFLGGQEVVEEDARVVSLQQIIDLDESVKEVLDIDKSVVVCRDSKEDKWKKQIL